MSLAWRFFSAIEQVTTALHIQAKRLAIFSSTNDFMTKYIFITGGVVSSLGKGIAASSLAAILEARGLKVTLTKLD
ncbi:MAG: hypothetical protein ABFS02_10990, partial [Pseudomonadota bacterium]